MEEDVDGEKEMEVPDECVDVDEDVEEDASLKSIFDLGYPKALPERKRVFDLMVI